MRETVIQFGEGVFLRGFADYFIDSMNKAGLYDGKIVVVQPRAGGKSQLLNEQGCKYNLYMRGIENGKLKTEHCFIESISRAIDPYKSFEKYMALADNPEFRFVISNTTEAGIAFDDSCEISDRPCKSFPGKLTQLLLRRFENGMDGFIFLPCELIDNNGDELKSCILKYAHKWKLSSSFINWINEKNSFLNTLVDRIVTGFPTDEAASLNPEDKLLDTCEYFHLWVIEGDCESELPLQKAGFNVIWTDNVAPYKKRKVRILNGGHTLMVAGALLSGLETVRECMEDETVFHFLDKCMKEEILPVTEDAGSCEKFASDVYDRFRNPYIKHKLCSISMNSVSKFSVRVLPTILEYKKEFGVYPKYLTMSLALLIEFYKTDAPDDLKEVSDFIRNETVERILSNQALWGCELFDMYDIIKDDLEKIKQHGARGAMKWILSQ